MIEYFKQSLIYFESNYKLKNDVKNTIIKKLNCFVKQDFHKDIVETLLNLLDKPIITHKNKSIIKTKMLEFIKILENDIGQNNNKNKNKYKFSVQEEIISRYCKIYIHNYTDPVLFVKEYDVINNLHIPENKLKTVERFESNGTNLLKFNDFISIFEKIQHPHIYQLQNDLELDIKYKCKHELNVLSKIVNRLGIYGQYQYEVVCPDGKKYIVDYVFLHKNKPLILIEINEKFHRQTFNKIKDGIRDDELIEIYGKHFFEISYDVSDTRLNEYCEEIKKILEFYDDEITIERMKKEFDDFTEIEAFSKKFGLRLINDTNGDNKFIFSLKEVKSTLQIKLHSDLDNQINSYFNYNDDENEIKPNKSNKIFNNDNDELDNSDDEIPSATKENNEQYLYHFRLDKDFIVKDSDYMISREAFMKIALRTDTSESNKIFDHFIKFEKMLKKMFDIIEKRREKTVVWINQRRLRRAYENRLDALYEAEIKRLKRENARKDELIRINENSN